MLQLGEQHETVEILQACDGKIVALERAAALEEMFRALLEELMAGRLRATALTPTPCGLVSQPYPRADSPTDLFLARERGARLLQVDGRNESF